MARPRKTPLTPTDLRLNAIVSAFGLSGIGELAQIIGADVTKVSKWGLRNSISKDGAAQISMIFKLPLAWVLDGAMPNGLPDRPPLKLYDGNRIHFGDTGPEQSESNQLKERFIKAINQLNEDELRFLLRQVEGMKISSAD